MKKLLSLFVIAAIITAAIFALGGCSMSSENKKIPFDYASLYRSERTEAYPSPAAGTTSRASYGYVVKAEQGYNDWFYMFGAAVEYTQMAYDLSSNRWKGGGAEMKEASMYATGSTEAVRKYKVSANGEAVIYGNYKCENESSPAAYLSVRLNDKLIYGGILSEGDISGRYFEINAQLQRGDSIYFSVSGKNSAVVCNPVVTYENSQNESLYHLSAKGKQYGDVFPWYDEKNGKLYMGFLWSDNAALADNYHDALEISDNMLTFTDVPEANNYEIWQRYKENYRKHFLFDCNRFIDRSIYRYGIRDNMLYFDEEKQRYLLIAGCYYSFDNTARTSDLVIYSSDDAYALSWTKPGNVVEAGYSGNLPECPSLMKIGDRWYVFVSVAYNTAHQVGPLQYWTGDAGLDCMDVDWSQKEFSFLDGEDLCAARVTQVGEKTYMWGWIPSTYDTMPWAPWAGYLNLPREIVQRRDGSLGGRLDPALSRLLNYGNVYTLSNGNFEIASGEVTFSDGALNMRGENNRAYMGSYSRNYITFAVDMKNSDKAAYVMSQNGKDYEVAIERENGKLYMKVLSPDDDKHTVNSVIEIKSDKTVFDVKLVCDGGFIEFFVNDEYALTARTAMDGSPYQAYMYSQGGADFSEVKINKLRPYGEL